MFCSSLLYNKEHKLYTHARFFVPLALLFVVGVVTREPVKQVYCKISIQKHHMEDSLFEKEITGRKPLDGFIFSENAVKTLYWMICLASISQWFCCLFSNISITSLVFPHKLCFPDKLWTVFSAVYFVNFTKLKTIGKADPNWKKWIVVVRRD